MHLTQKMALWYPSARNMPILSSKSAPGIIIATGIYDQSMKGHPAVFMSRDAGVTWRHVSYKHMYILCTLNQGHRS